jgi:hypothetical protein
LLTTGTLSSERKQMIDKTIRVQAHTEKSLEAKVYNTLSETWKARYPDSISHCQRLIVERLQLGLDKRIDGFDMHDVETWALRPSEIESLTIALDLLDKISQRHA